MSTSNGQAGNSGNLSLFFFRKIVINIFQRKMIKKLQNMNKWTDHVLV